MLLAFDARSHVSLAISTRYSVSPLCIAIMSQNMRNVLFRQGPSHDTEVAVSMLVVFRRLASRCQSFPSAIRTASTFAGCSLHIGFWINATQLLARSWVVLSYMVIVEVGFLRRRKFRSSIAVLQLPMRIAPSDISDLSDCKC